MKRDRLLRSAIVFATIGTLGTFHTATAESLTDIYRQALQSDPTYLASTHQHQASSELYKQARALLLPTLDFDYSYTQTDQKIVSSDNAVFATGDTDFPTYEYEVSLNQSIYSYAHWAQFRKAKAEVQRAAAELEDARQDLILRSAEAYFAVLAERESFDYVVAEKDAIKKHYDLVRVKHRDGLVRTTDLALSEARYMSALADEIDIANALDDSRRGIKEMTGALPERLQLLVDKLPMAPPEPSDKKEWVDLAQVQNPMVLMQRATITVAEEEMKRQKGGHYPTLDLVYRYNDRETDGSLFGGGSEVETQDVMVQFNLPLYAGGSVSSRVSQAVSLQNKAREELEVELRNVERETLAAYQGVVGAIARVKALQKSVAAQELAVRTKITAYESGLATTLAVLDATRDLYLARRDYASARHDYILNTLRLKRMVGSLTAADLEEVNRLLVR